MTSQPQSTFAAVATRDWLQPLLTPWVRRAALVGLVASFVFPTAGLGVDLCPIHRVTGLPCPGCGVTRALASLSQGDLSLAVGLNPFVLVLWPGLVLGVFEWEIGHQIPRNASLDHESCLLWCLQPAARHDSHKVSSLRRPRCP